MRHALKNHAGQAHRSRQGYRGAFSWACVAALSLGTMLQPLATLPAQAQSESRNYVRITEANASIPKQIFLGLDKSLVVDLPADAHDILVANPAVADAVTRTSRRIYLFGKRVGQTNVFVFDGRGKQIAAMEIRIERDIAGLEDTLSRLIPNSRIRAEILNDNVVLTGSVSTPQDAAKAVELARAFVTGGEATESNDDSLSALFGEDKESEIINMLKIDGEDQVHLKVKIVEIQRAVVKQLGITTSVTNPGGLNASDDGFGFSTIASGANQLIAGNNSGGTFNLMNGLNSINAQLRALESTGVMRMLAEPSLTAISGETATFKAGGSYQVPQEVTRDDGAIAIRYDAIDYGVTLNFKPIVLTEGRISLKIETEVQEPSAMGASQLLNEANLPGVRHRQASTTVELPSGGSMVIAGLLQDDVRQVVSGHPGLKNIPILGTLFRSREYIRNESELMVVVTPYLVRPVARNKIVSPAKNFQPASDSAGIFMGRVNRVYGTKQGDLPKGRYTGSIGFILK